MDELTDEVELEFRLILEKATTIKNLTTNSKKLGEARSFYLLKTQIQGAIENLNEPIRNLLNLPISKNVRRTARAIAAHIDQLKERIETINNIDPVGDLILIIDLLDEIKEICDRIETKILNLIPNIEMF